MIGAGPTGRRVALSGIAVAVVCLGLATGPDRTVAMAMRDVPRPLVEAAAVLSFIGWPVIWYGAAAVVLIAAGVGRKFIAVRPSARMFEGTVALLATGAAVAVIKIVAARARPELLFSDGVYGFRVAGWGEAFRSFPSGHAAAGFALAAVLARSWPRGRIGLYVLATLIAASRVVLGRHYPGDVIAGAWFGVIVPSMILQGRSEDRQGITARW